MPTPPTPEPTPRRTPKPTEAPTTLKPTEAPTEPTYSPTSNPTPTSEAVKSLLHVPDMMVPIILFSECEALTSSQASDFKSAVYGAQTASYAFRIIGYICIGLFIIYAWYCAYLYGQYKASRPYQY